MGDVVAVNLEPSDERPRRGRSRTMWELMHPDDVRAGWRDLPRLVGNSLRLVWEVGRRTFVLTSVLQLLTAVAAGVQLFATKYALESVLKAGSGESFASVVPAILILVGLAVVMEVASAVESEQSRVLRELVARRAFDRVLDVATRIDLIAYESPDFYDRLRRANMQVQFRSLQTVQSLLGLAGAAIAAVGIVAALTSLQPWLLPIVLLGYVPLWLVTKRNTRDSYHFAFGMTPNDRQRNYLQSLLLGRDSAKEVRAFDLAPFLRRRYDRLYDERISELRALARRRTVRALVGSLASSGVAAGAAATLAYLYASGRLSLAATGAAVFGLYQLRGRLQAMHFSVSGLYEATLFIRDYASFLELEPAARPRVRGSASLAEARAARPFGRLEVDDVSFVYPDADRPALDEVSLEIGAGEAFFRDAPFVFLDEPTAALDARAESDLFERMRELLAERAVLLISHRFSSVRSADRIYVLREGRVVERGRHEELMTEGGLYAELFTLQARQYVDVPSVDRPLGTRLSTIDAPTFLFGADFPGSLDAEGGGNAAPP